MTRRITSTDKENARRLKNLYLAKRKDLELTQHKIADRVGMKQGAVAQYFNGHIALNYEAVIKFAKVLDVEPWKIDPSLHVVSGAKPETDPEVTVLVKRCLPIDDKPTITTVQIRYDGMTKQLHGYEINSDDYAPFLRQGDVAIVDNSLQPEVGDDVVLELSSGNAVVGELEHHDANRVTILLHDTQDPLTLNLSEVNVYSVIVSVRKRKKNRMRRIGPASMVV